MSKDNMKLGELAKKYPDKTYKELEDIIHTHEAKKGVCVTGALKKDLSRGKEIDYHRYWKDMYEKEHKLRQEAEGETTIVKAVGMNSPEIKDLRARVKELDKSLAIALEINESHQRYNGKLQRRLTELEEEKEKLKKQISDHIENKMETYRKSGM